MKKITQVQQIDFDKKFIDNNLSKKSIIKKLVTAFSLSTMVLLSGCDKEIPNGSIDKYEKGESVLIHEENGVKFFALNINGSRYYYAEGNILDKNKGIGELKGKIGESSIYKVSWKSTSITEHSVYVIENSEEIDKSKLKLKNEWNGLKAFILRVDGTDIYYAEGNILDENKGIDELKGKTGDSILYKMSWKTGPITSPVINILDNQKYRSIHYTYLVGRTIFNRDICILKSVK